MGIVFTAIADHSLSGDELCELPALLARAWKEPPRAVLDVHPDLAGRTGWHFRPDRRYSNVAEELSEQGYLSLDGPAGFHFAVFRKAVEISHLARWWSFASLPDLHSGLRGCCREIGDVLRARTIIYLPDSWHRSSQASDLLFKNASADDVLLWLEKEIGPPASSATELLTDEDETTDSGYMVEKLQTTV